ncbi:MAG: glycosyltransferase [Acidobacteriaceae bacterium]|nr:glycosyltransferase [Acidobacteriaceae bacterium]
MLRKWPVLLMVRSLDYGGCERDASKIAIGLDRELFEPHIAVFFEGGFRTREVESAGVPILGLPVRSFLNSSVIRGARRLHAYFRRHQIQLVHAFDVPLDIFGAPVARFSRVPVVITSQLSFRNMYSARERIALRLTDWLSDRVVVNSRAVGDSLERDTGLSAGKIYLCYNGVNPRDFSPGQGVHPSFLQGASLVVGSVCVMRPEKRMDLLIESFAQIRQIDSGLRLLLVGEGSELPRLMALRSRLGLEDVCHFEPARPDVAAWMRSMDIYVNCSSSESFPNGLLEAMACGCCVIGAKVGGIPELVTHLEDGLVFDSENAGQLAEMLRLAVSSPTLRQTLRHKAVITAHQRFSMQATIQRTEALYQTLLEQRGVVAPPLPAC